MTGNVRSLLKGAQNTHIAEVTLDASIFADGTLTSCVCQGFCGICSGTNSKEHLFFSETILKEKSELSFSLLVCLLWKRHHCLVVGGTMLLRVSTYLKYEFLTTEDIFTREDT